MAGISKNWMQISNRLSLEYRNGVKDFLDFAFKHTDLRDKIWCPCVKCNNTRYKSRDDVEADLVIHGIVPSYTQWSLHGERVSNIEDNIDVHEDVNMQDEERDDIQELIHDVCGVHYVEDDNFTNLNANDQEEHNEGTSKFHRLLSEAETSLYPNCEKFSKLSFVLKLWQLKCLHEFSNKAFDALLKLFKEALPEGETLPSSFYEAKKMIRDLGLYYKKIDACINDCMLFWKEYANEDHCTICGVSRWKSNKGKANFREPSSSRNSRKIPVKTLWHFPLIPRLQRLYVSSKIASDMKWHHEKRLKDGALRHPADSQAWKHLDELYPSFAIEPRNVRLGLASDGFNPFGNMSTAHSTWPVVLIPYNLPPWLCMKQPSFILSLLIPGPKALGNDIDVYLQPLIEELKELWERGVDTYDALMKQKFRMHVALLWTINDFPAYGNLSGWSTKGKLACPSCNKDTYSYWLKHCGKFCYTGSRRFLALDHKWRNSKKAFNGEKELRPPPMQLSGDDVLNELRGLEHVTFGKSGKKRKRGNITQSYNWKKKSIFFELPYWKDLLIRHNLDVMHIEKNICDSIIGTLLNIEEKTKDSLKARHDLKDIGIREKLHPILHEGKWIFSAACYTLSMEEKRFFCEFLKNIKVPDGYSSNISRCMHLKECKIFGLKSHDCHVLLLNFLPLAIRGRLSKPLSEALIELSTFLKELSSKVLWMEDLEKLESTIAITLCKLEMIFPPSFFDIMMHLPLHLATEAKIAGPVQYRWMYPIERYLHILKRFVRNKSHPEGSIAEGYIAEECVTFCSRYLHGVETRLNRLERNYDSSNAQSHHGLAIFARLGCAFQNDKEKVRSKRKLSRMDLLQAHLYVLKNCNEALPYINEYDQMMANSQVHDASQLQDTQLSEWFEKHVTQLYFHENGQVSEELYQLACGPDSVVTIYDGYKINGFKFHTMQRDSGRVTQNSGVFVKEIVGTTNIDYYGILTDIVELHYMGGNRIILFKCIWWDVHSPGRGIEKDRYGFISVNTKRKLNTNEPYVLAYQVEQVFYIQDNIKPDFLVVVKTQPRSFYDMPIEKEDIDLEEESAFQQDESSHPEALSNMIENYDEVDDWVRSGIPPQSINADLLDEDRFENTTNSATEDDSDEDNDSLTSSKISASADDCSDEDDNDSGKN